MNIALIADDGKKELMVQFCIAYCGILAKHTGKTEKQIEKDADRDNYMTAEEAAAYGLVDKVLTHHSDGRDDKKKAKA